MKRPEDINLSRDEGEALIERLETDTWTAEDRQVLAQVVRLYFWLLFTLKESTLSLKRLQALLFGSPSKKSKRKSSPPSPPANPGDEVASTEPANSEHRVETSDSEPVETGETSDPPEVSGEKTAGDEGRRGHGRLSAEAYSGAQRVECRHEELAPGDRCPACGIGWLYSLPPGRDMRIHGHALLSAVRYDLEKLRCNACGERFTAKPPETAGEETYSSSARAALALSRYVLSVPFSRLKAYQALVGVPVPDATQWDQVEGVADCAYPVFEHLVNRAAQGDLIYQDDRPVRILSLIKENQGSEAAATDSSAHTGMQSTALGVESGGHTLCLYFSGRADAGENLKALLDKRAAERDPPLVMSECDPFPRNSLSTGDEGSRPPVWIT